MKSETLSRKALNRALLARQMLLAREEVSPLAAIERLVGLQAQQAQPPFVGLWTRVANFEREALLRALHERAVVRATLMRGTLHLMSAADYLAVRGALQPGLTAGMRAVLRERAESLDIPALVAHAHTVFQEGPRTFTALRGALPDADERAMGYAVRTHLPLVMVPDGSDWGFPADSDFALAEGWLGQAPSTAVDAAPLVLRYLAAFGPATAADAQSWAGLGGLKDVFERLRPQLWTGRDERKRELFDLPEAPRPSEDSPAPVRFVPGFDNLVLSHADRSRIIADEHRPRVVTRNLQVLPTFLVEGFVAGTWKWARGKKAATLTVTPFGALAKGARAQLAEEAESLLRWLEPGAERRTIEFKSA